MKPVYTAKYAIDAHLIRGYLESQGVAAIVRGEYLAGGVGELPVDLCKVCVVNDGEFAHADELVQRFLQGAGAREHAHEHWRCTGCGEALEGQFTACWNCGSARAG